MKRKIVQHGSSSLTISLPYKWAKEHSLKKGDELDIIENGTELKIYVGQKGTCSKTKFVIKDKKLFLNRYIINLYKQGYDEIEIVCNEGIPYEKINSVLSEVLGFEIVEQGIRHCTIKNVAQPVGDELDNMLRRAFRVTISMGNDTLEELKMHNQKNLKEIARIQYTNNRLTNLCQRILAKRGYKEHTKTFYLYGIIDQIEQIGDNFGDLCDYISEKNVSLQKNELAKLEEVNKLFELAYEVFYSFNENKMIKLKNNIHTLSLALILDLTKNKTGNTVFTSYLIQVVERINHIALYMIHD